MKYIIILALFTTAACGTDPGPIYVYDPVADTEVIEPVPTPSPTSEPEESPSPTPRGCWKHPERKKKCAGEL